LSINGSDDITVRKLPGLRKFTNITLKRGLVADVSFWNWMMQSMQGSVQRTSVSVVLLDEDRNEVLRWEFARAWPCKWFCSGFNAKSSEIAIETLEICHEGMVIDGQAG
jgi:phage tail-like protein